MKKFIVTTLLFGLLLVGCGAPVSVSADKDTLATLNKAIDALNNAPLSWHLVLEEPALR